LSPVGVYVLHDVWFALSPTALPCVKGDVVEIDEWVRNFVESSELFEDCRVIILVMHFLGDLLLPVSFRMEPAPI